jgi:hypothetical protein
MATLTTNIATAKGHGIGSRFWAFVERFAEARSRTAQVEVLMAKTDAELAAMGLTRDTIVLHVFRDRLYA